MLLNVNVTADNNHSLLDTKSLQIGYWEYIIFKKNLQVCNNGYKIRSTCCSLVNLKIF